MNSLTNGGLLPARSHADRVRCIVVEAGASWLTPVSDGFDETIVVTQTAGELPAVFAQRVMARVAGVERAHRRLESLSLLMGDRQDRASIAARRLIVLGLAAHARAHGGASELLLKASAKASTEARAELLGLVEEVMTTSNGQPVPVRLVFDDQRPTAETRSGIFPAVSMSGEHRTRLRVG
jgi:hypothetical protein